MSSVPGGHIGTAVVWLCLTTDSIQLMQHKTSNVRHHIRQQRPRSLMQWNITSLQCLCMNEIKLPADCKSVQGPCSKLVTLSEGGAIFKTSGGSI